MERTITVHEVYDKENNQFIEKAYCPFCKRSAIGAPLQLYADKHLVRLEHGCGGYVAIFQEKGME